LVSEAVPILVGAADAYETVNNASSLHQLVTVNYDGSTYVLLGDVTVPIDIDYSASTIALTTSCIPISTACNLTGVSGVSAPYFCSEAFYGDLYPDYGAPDTFGDSTWRLSLFEDAGLTVPVNVTIPTNPTYLGIASYVLGNAAPSDGLPNNGSSHLPLWNDPEIVHPCCNDGNAFILRCKPTTYDVSYTWFNGSFGTFIAISPSNLSLAGIINGPQQDNYTFGSTQYVNGAILAAFSNTSQELADRLALVYSQTTLGLASGVLSPRENLLEQARNPLLVSRVPKAPLFTLVSLNLLYGFGGIVLASIALYENGKPGVTEMKRNLSIWGILEYSFMKNGVDITNFLRRT
jgi:hypothetical protein